MGTWVVGDVQGCRASLESLLDVIAFDRAADTLWLAGDLVNRGPDSLGVLRLVVDLGERAVPILGNHDLHLLSTAAGVRAAGGGDTFDEILAADDCEALLQWLTQRPFAHRQTVAGRDVLMLHAGLHPLWSATRAVELATELSTALTSGALFDALGEPGHPAWSDDLTGGDRLRSLVGYFTRLRACSPTGTPVAKYTGPPAGVPEGASPWWAVPNRAAARTLIVCGHWAAQGLRREPGMVALDSGCVWGKELTALCLETDEIASVPCSDDVL